MMPLYENINPSWLQLKLILLYNKSNNQLYLGFMVLKKHFLTYLIDSINSDTFQDNHTIKYFCEGVGDDSVAWHGLERHQWDQ